MPDFREMYFSLFREMSKAITILQEAQQQTENMYISDDSANQLFVVDPDKHDKDQHA